MNARAKVAEYEEEAEVLRAQIEKGVAKLALSYSEQKLVLAAIEGGGKEIAATGPAYLLPGIESMQKTYTGFFSGAGCMNLPPDVRDKQKEFENALAHMADLATKFAEYQQQISKAIVAKSTVSAAAGTIVVPDGAAVS